MSYAREYAKIDEDLIEDAWEALCMPKLLSTQAVFEHGYWWVVGYNTDDEKQTYSVELATGPGSAYGLTFEEC